MGWFMTDLSHQTQLPTIARHLDDRFYLPLTWIEPSISKRGERPDCLSVAERNLSWPGRDEFDVLDVVAGMAVISEYKSSVSDLRADDKKPWRDPALRAMGDYRLAWLRKGGAVRAEHVDEGNGWGVVEYDDTTADLVREPQLFHNVNTWKQTALVVAMLKRQQYASKGKPRKQSGGKHVDAAVELIRKYPGLWFTVGLKTEIGYPQSAGKLAKELEADPRITQPYAGAAWEVRE